MGVVIISNPIEALVTQRRGDGFNCREALRDDAEWMVCFKCRKKHRLRHGNEDHDATDFADRHPLEGGCFPLRMGPAAMERAVRHAQAWKRFNHHSVRDFTHNASVLEAFGTVTALDLTGIGIASSVTAGWCSCWIDNSSGLYLDIAVWYYSQAVNTAASSQKSHFLYGPGSWLTTDLPVNTAGNTVTNSSTTSATLTYLDITANPVGFPLLKVVPYITTNKAIQGGLFGFAKGHDMTCPKVVWLGLVNAAGPTIGTGGGTPTKISYAGAYNTVA